MSQRQIARALNIHNSIGSRKLRRNAAPDGYDPEQAQALSDDRRRYQQASRVLLPFSSRAVRMPRWFNPILWHCSSLAWTPSGVAVKV